MIEVVKNPFASVRAALFDLDGTLIQTQIDFDEMRRAMHHLVQRYGVPVDPGVRDILAIVEEARTILYECGDTERAAELRREAFAVLERIEEEHCQNPTVVPGAAPLLDYLHRRSIGIGIVTRNCRRVSEQLVRVGKLTYDVLVTRDDVSRTKPHPEHLDHALQLLSVERLEHKPIPAVITGDHWMDVQAGRAAGIRTIGLLLGRSEAFFAPAMPDLLVNELADLLPLVEQDGSAAACSAP